MFKQLFCFFTIIVFTESCFRLDQPIADYYSNSENIVGGNKPTAPQMNPLEVNAEGSFLSWSASVDPDTNQEVPVYFLYVCEFEPAHSYQVFYCPFIANQNYFVSPRRYLIPSNLVSGTYFFAATGYDSWSQGRESDPSDILKVEIP